MSIREKYNTNINQQNFWTVYCIFACPGFTRSLVDKLHNPLIPDCLKIENEQIILWLLAYSISLNSVYANIQHDSALPQGTCIACTTHWESIPTTTVVRRQMLAFHYCRFSWNFILSSSSIKRERSCPQETIDPHLKVCDRTFTKILACFLYLVIVCFCIWFW